MINQLTEKLMSTIGLDVNDKCMIVDQDFGTAVAINGKFLKCEYNNEQPFVGRNDIYFDPLNNIKLMVSVFSYFLQKWNQLNGLYIRSFCQVNGIGGTSALDIKGDVNYISGYYKSETLKYVDAIFRLSGYENVDFLKQFDTQVR